ncbi:STAS domain-containing protein [Rarobacter incanus]|uniref:Anti-anti-sigma factor n=1 Tax=Rarobacter incanus TaxID=153494 RepID=A0A542SQF0_9MICO|nr:STAS domain-containing protein [Rarobacter incanus]TQK76841.1 anti-anti-sigma factor [Rarobacter incanus]
MLELATSVTTTTLVIVGDLDFSVKDRFPEVAARIAGLRRSLLVIDMCRTSFVDSTGAAFLISLADAAGRRGGEAILRGCADRHLFVLETCGALDLFRVDADYACPVDSGELRLGLTPVDPTGT